MLLLRLRTCDMPSAKTFLDRNDMPHQLPSEPIEAGARLCGDHGFGHQSGELP